MVTQKKFKLNTMQKIFTLIVLFISLQSVAQTEKKEELNCYNKWAAKFDERGAEDVADGTYTDVIVTFRNGDKADCYDGKVIVKDKKVQAIYLLLEDNTYELVNRVWKNDPKNIAIVNGISEALIAKDNSLINVLWVKKIKAKKASPKKAAEPTDD